MVETEDNQLQVLTDRRRSAPRLHQIIGIYYFLQHAFHHNQQNEECKGNQTTEGMLIHFTFEDYHLAVKTADFCPFRRNEAGPLGPERRNLTCDLHSLYYNRV